MVERHLNFAVFPCFAHPYRDEWGLRQLFRRIRWIVGTCGLVAAAIGFFSSPYYEVAKVALDYQEPYAIASYRLANLPKSDFEREIEQAIDDAEFDDARQIVEIGEAQGHVFDPELVARTIESPGARTIREGTDFARGFITGEVKGVSGFAGAVSSDFMVVGDIRDILIQGPRAISGQDYDKFVLGLSLVGIATVLPSGPIDVGASVLKTAKRTGKMSARLSKGLTHTLKRLVDVAALNADLHQLAPLGEGGGGECDIGGERVGARFRLRIGIVEIIDQFLDAHRVFWGQYAIFKKAANIRVGCGVDID